MAISRAEYGKDLPVGTWMSRARVYLAGQDDELVQVAALPELAPDWRRFLMLSPANEVEVIQHHEGTGFP